MTAYNDDQELVDAILRGDFEQYSQLVKKYNRDVVKVVSAMLFNYDEVDDLVQKVFIEAYDKLERFDTKRNFAKWLKGIARNSVRMHLRSDKTSEKHISIYRDWAVTQMEADENFELIDSKTKALESCYSKVSDTNRTIMEMKYRKHLSIQEISNSLNRTIEGITKALSRTRAELRICIKRAMNND
jgi:RNA polymerase sigma-70 factor, ECF subfamily